MTSTDDRQRKPSDAAPGNTMDFPTGSRAIMWFNESYGKPSVDTAEREESFPMEGTSVFFERHLLAETKSAREALISKLSEPFAVDRCVLPARVRYPVPPAPELTKLQCEVKGALQTAVTRCGGQKAVIGLTLLFHTVSMDWEAVRYAHFLLARLSWGPGKAGKRRAGVAWHNMVCASDLHAAYCANCNSYKGLTLIMNRLPHVAVSEEALSTVLSCQRTIAEASSKCVGALDTLDLDAVAQLVCPIWSEQTEISMYNLSWVNADTIRVADRRMDFVARLLVREDFDDVGSDDSFDFSKSQSKRQRRKPQPHVTEMLIGDIEAAGEGPTFIEDALEAILEEAEREAEAVAARAAEGALAASEHLQLVVRDDSEGSGSSCSGSSASSGSSTSSSESQGEGAMLAQLEEQLFCGDCLHLFQSNPALFKLSDLVNGPGDTVQLVSCNLPESPRISQNLSESPRISQNLTESPRDSQNLTEPHRSPMVLHRPTGKCLGTSKLIIRRQGEALSSIKVNCYHKECSLLLYGHGMWDAVQLAVDRWISLGALYLRNDDGSLKDITESHRI